MKKDIVLHSLDPFLLMRMFTDLQMDGRFDEDLEWNKYYNPMADKNDEYKLEACMYLWISDDNILGFHTHDCDSTLIPLTEQNYLSTLKMILE